MCSDTHGHGSCTTYTGITANVCYTPLQYTLSATNHANGTVYFYPSASCGTGLGTGLNPGQSADFSTSQGSYRFNN